MLRMGLIGTHRGKPLILEGLRLEESWQRERHVVVSPLFPDVRRQSPAPHDNVARVCVVVRIAAIDCEKGDEPGGVSDAPHGPVVLGMTLRQVTPLALRRQIDEVQCRTIAGGEHVADNGTEQEVDPESLAFEREDLVGFVEHPLGVARRPGYLRVEARLLARSLSRVRRR